MKKNLKVKEELINKARKITGLNPTKKFGTYSEKELRGYALFAQILDEKGFQTPAHWDNWKWDPDNKVLSVNVHWWQLEEGGTLVFRSAWVHFEDTAMSGNSVKGFFKRFLTAPHFIDWNEVSALKERALPDDPVEEGEDE
jgi:hypothetical protein|nr:MAG TPA: hypothetical protein [Caudoviricetes sp.]